MTKRLNFKLLLFVFFVAACGALFSYAPVSALPPVQGSTPAPNPHPSGNFTECTACHATGASSAPKYPADHDGRANDSCQTCHLPAGAANQQATPTPTAPLATPAAPESGSAQPTTQSSGPPNIPHPLEGRDNCLACHQTGVGGAPKVPASHAGRTIQMCRGCHQPAQPTPTAGQAPQAMPTLISHPTAAAGQDSCVNCHRTVNDTSAAIVQDWQASIHATRNVGCADCHGGDPTKATKEEAMSSSAGFVGKPKKADIPALCASCHARVEMMRQYDLPTDQWAQYQQSIHGKKLAQGDTNVPTCFNCHDGHGTKQVNDPAASVYALNVPSLCSNCHSNAELMKPYGIPTNQYELYKASVHGVALLEKQDTRAPTCATCHGTHGAAPPGFQEVANVCGSCHSATQDYYLKGPHASNAPGTPKCVTCHGRYDVGHPTEAMFQGDGARQCGSCHSPGSPPSAGVQEIADRLGSSAKAVDQAQAALDRAAGSALIIAPEELKLADAKTNLITARAAQHTLDLTLVKEKTDKATAVANAIVADADKASADSIFRRQFMGVGLGIMALAIGSLYAVRRELYKQLPKE